jgi:2-dehydro-3-deoxyphosphogluconate aldolase/(4S)-4-hydroxy-2-oxoglutarate aldolase
MTGGDGLYLGVDVGTSATRVSLVRPDGSAEVASAGYRTVRGGDGRVEQDPAAWSRALGEAHRCGVPYVGGALTPTEVLASMRAGADAVKLFPVGSVGGAGYLRALREPLPGLRAVVSGGIAAGEVGGYLAAGAHAVCLGGALIDREAARLGDTAAVAAWARAALDRINAEVG